MPFYDYRCVSCGERFELKRAIADRDAPSACPGCGHPKVRRELPRVSASVAGSRGCEGAALGGCGSAGGGG